MMAPYIYRVPVFLILLVSSFLVAKGIGYLTLLFFVSASLVFVLLEKVLIKMSVSAILCAIAGLLTGTLTALLLVLPFRYILSPNQYDVLSFFLLLLFGLAFMIVGAIRGASLTSLSLRSLFNPPNERQETFIVDASVLIDGRIADIVDAGFMSGVFIIPHFILQEIQYIADSPDTVRRARGKRALEIVKRLQKTTGLQITISEEDFPHLKDVDSKLIALARKKEAKVITNDYNLQKVAQIQGVATLNINELAKALKTLVMPGEELTLFIIKEGKEPNQGVAYLEDGTMVVVENGRHLIGKNIQAEVTSVLQTTGGRMTFARPKGEH